MLESKNTTELRRVIRVLAIIMLLGSDTDFYKPFGIVFCMIRKEFLLLCLLNYLKINIAYFCGA